MKKEEPGQWLKGKEKKKKVKITKEMLWIKRDKGETRLCRIKGRCSKKGTVERDKKKRRRQRQRQEDWRLH